MLNEIKQLETFNSSFMEKQNIIIQVLMKIFRETYAKDNS
jgi:hypothetical protein